jgi:hypothetical protein
MRVDAKITFGLGLATPFFSKRRKIRRCEFRLSYFERTPIRTLKIAQPGLRAYLTENNANVKLVKVEEGLRERCGDGGR